MITRTRMLIGALACGGLALVLATAACSGDGAPDEPATSDADRRERVAGGEGTTPDPTGEAEGPSLVVPEEFAERWAPWTGDLDGIRERRYIRMLVTYNSTNYFVDRGEQGGLAFEAGRLLEKELNRRFKKGNLGLDVVFVPVTRDRLIPALVEGHGDIAASTLTITEGRRARVGFTEPTTREVNEIVVTGPGAPPIARLEDLAGQEVHVRASSSFAESLRDLNASFAARGLEPVKVIPVDERLESEDVLEMVNAGVYPISVLDDFMVSLWEQVLPHVQGHPDLVVRSGGRLGWAIRKGSPKLKELLDGFIRRNRQGTLTGNVLINRYFKDVDWVRNPQAEEDARRFREMIALFRKYGDQYDLDYLLVTAQAYQESGLDQSKRSRAGAVGVMQLLPSTARDKNVGIPNIETLENNVHAGVKYLRFILDRYFADADMDEVEKHLFAFASYNAGPRRIAGLRAKAEQMGLDPNEWMGNVEVVAAREIGAEPVRYVSNILKYYLAYRLVEERQAERQRVKGRT
jgi:membrane-bound lytic murein transglycosylase MltF